MRLVASLALVLSAAVAADAQELEPRAYRTLPTGLNFAVVNLQLSRGNVLADPTSPLQDLDVDVLVTAVGYLRSFGLMGRSASFTAAVPWVVMSGSATFLGEPVSDTRSGAADLRLRLAVNLIGGPALTPREFAAYRQGRNLGVSLTVTAPTGQYDRNRLVNFGNNRWGVKPEIGYSSIQGPWILEAAAGVWLFTDNTEFAGDQTRSQKPIGAFQAHLSYNFPGGIWVGLGANYYTGGRTAIDGVESQDLQRNSRLGATVSLPIGRRHSLKLSANTGAYTSAGADFDVLAVAYQVRW